MSHYAENKQYEGVMETNAMNLDIANRLNQTNREIQNSVNQTNLTLAKQQNDWNIAQWTRENEYNSPSQQVKRLLAAGLNPAFANGVGDVGNAQHLESSDLANQSATHLDARPDIRNPRDGFAERENARMSNKIAAAGQLSSLLKEQADIKKSQFEIAQIDQAMKLAGGNNPLQMANLQANTEAQKGSAAVAFGSANRMMQLLSGELQEQKLGIQRQHEEIGKVIAEKNKLAADTAIANENLKWIPKQYRADIVQKMAQVSDIYDNIDLRSITKAISREEFRWMSHLKLAEWNKINQDYKNAIQQGRIEQWRADFMHMYHFDPANSSMFSNIYQQAIQGDINGSDYLLPLGIGLGTSLVTKNPSGLFKFGTKLFK